MNTNAKIGRLLDLSSEYSLSLHIHARYVDEHAHCHKIVEICFACIVDIADVVNC